LDNGYRLGDQSSSDSQDLSAMLRVDEVEGAKMQALRHEFGLPAQSSLSEPFYK
jgi:hypothetical protein